MHNEVEYHGVLPEPDDITAPYWQAAHRGQLVIQRCEECGRLRFPPDPNCPWCASERVEWTPLSGNGTVFTYIWIHQAFLPQFAEKLPYNVVQIALNEDSDVLVTGNVVGVEKCDLMVGLRVSAVFDRVHPDHTLIRWQPQR